ncbi:MAG: hypothetical protein PWR01_4550 [Clostridiales bacterium]|nr:hypothetical protein [Clostridiales bacterium]MDN5283477.1 hypothetical protein [Candidatus Ozemobacter sp.]
MKSQEMKNAFKKMADEAGADKKLNLAIQAKVEQKRTNIPVKKLKRLFIQFLILMVPVVIIYLILPLLGANPVESVSAINDQFDIDSMYSWKNIEVFSDMKVLFLSFCHGVLRGFILLSVLTFILTAAAMTVDPSEKKQEVCHA